VDGARGLFVKATVYYLITTVVFTCVLKCARVINYNPRIYKNHMTFVQWRGYKFGLNSLNAPDTWCLATGLIKRLAPFDFARGHMQNHVPESLAVGGWRHPNRPIVWTIFRNRSELGFNACFGACSWFMHTEVRFVEPVPAK